MCFSSEQFVKIRIFFLRFSLKIKEKIIFHFDFSFLTLSVYYQTNYVRNFSIWVKKFAIRLEDFFFKLRPKKFKKKLELGGWMFISIWIYHNQPNIIQFTRLQNYVYIQRKYIDKVLLKTILGSNPSLRSVISAQK